MGASRGRGGHRKALVGGATGLAVIGIVLGLVFGVFLDESPSHANTPPNGGNAAAIGPASKVSDPPPSDKSAELGQKTGICRVPIRSYYSNFQWGAQVKCFDGGFNDDLLTVKNKSTVPVYLNEWYAKDWHGVTTVSPGQTIIMPLYGGLAPAIWAGACWPVHFGSACQVGPDHQLADVDFIRTVPATTIGDYMFVRDSNRRGIPARFGKEWAAVNLGITAVQLHWPALGRDKWVDLPPGQTIKNIPPPDIEGRKDLGSGAVALVQLIPTPHETGTNIYHMVTPTDFHGHQRPATMTWLFGGNWCSAQLQNLGPQPVRLQVWSVPYVVSSGPDLSLGQGQSGTLNVRGATLVTGLVGAQETGNFTTVKAHKWNDCPT